MSCRQKFSKGPSAVGSGLKAWFWEIASRLNVYVKPGAALSLQSHKYRSEHWIVVQGIASVTIDQEIKTITEGESVYVPLGAIHRMENLEQNPMVLIEVQIGTYLEKMT